MRMNMEDADGLPPPPPYSVLDPNNSQLHPAGVITEPVVHVQEKKKAKDKIPNSSNGEPAFLSGKAYFAMNPASIQSDAAHLTYRISCLRDRNFSSIRFPGAKSVMLERNLSEEDWFAFLNHLEIEPSSAGSSRGSLLETENIKVIRINMVTAEWNQGFFGPRKLRIVVETGSQTETASRRSTRQASLKSVTTSSDESIGLALYQAVSKGNAKLVQTLLDSGADANRRPSCAKPALTLAVEKNEWHIAKMLLERGQPDLESTAPAGETALYAAVSRGYEDLVDLMLSYGADARAKPPGSEPALYKAASKGFTGIVRSLVNSENIDLDATPPGGSSSTYRAYEKGNIEIMADLLRNGANPNVKASGGAPLLHKAAGKADFHTTRLLLEYGANPDDTPPGGATALFNAAKKGEEAIAKILIDYGADVNKKPAGSNTALWVAADKGHQSVVKSLVHHGADVDATTCGGNTALWHAVKRGDYHMAGLLLLLCAKPDEKTAGGETALMIASSKGNTSMVSTLLAWGADPHKKCGGSDTPISRAAKKGHQEIVTMMLERRTFTSS